jgi:hypothetical protein
MALPEADLLDERVVQCYATNISSAGSAFTVSPCEGYVTKVWSVIENAITVADNTVTTKIAATAITGGVITITQSGSAAGDVDSAVPTALNHIYENQNIEFAYTGSTTACATQFFATIRQV